MQFRRITYEFMNTFEFIELINFYLIHTPCQNASKKAIPLCKYGWETPWKGKNSLKNLLKQVSKKNLLFSAKNNASFSDAINVSGIDNLINSKKVEEIICFVNSKGNQFISVFNHIRNSFAHGNFEVYSNDEQEFFILEDSYRQKQTAKMIITKSTLLEWIKIIKAGPRN